MSQTSKTGPGKTKDMIFQITFYRKISKFTENKLQKLSKQIGKEDTEMKIVFNPFKLALQLKIRYHMV